MAKKGKCPACNKSKGYKQTGKQEVPKPLQKELGKTITLVTCNNDDCRSTTNKARW